MNATTYGLDIAKHVFQLYWLDLETGEIHNQRFQRQKLIEFLAKREPGRVALEACGSGHWWARKLMALGYEVKLLHAKFVRPFVQTNKTDAADARAIWTAAQQLDIPAVTPKTVEQQATLVLHRMREQHIKMRTMMINALRGALYEFGLSFKKGRQAGLAEMRERLAEVEEDVPARMFEALREQFDLIGRLDKGIEGLEGQIKARSQTQPECQRLMTIPGIGMLTATALVATIGDARGFRSGRQLSAYLGLVPRQHGTGGKVRLGAISKRGDRYLRMLLIHGARAVLFRAKDKGLWCEQLARRRPTNVTVVALANKAARTAWAVLMGNEPYERNHELKKAERTKQTANSALGQLRLQRP
ncbi:IS110 family transposase [Cupriavidus basilensis]